MRLLNNGKAHSWGEADRGGLKETSTERKASEGESRDITREDETTVGKVAKSDARSQRTNGQAKKFRIV